MALTETQKRFLKKLAHAKKPVVLVGEKGITDGLVNELDLSLEHHELLKVKVSAGDRQERDALIGELTERTRSELVQRIGNVAVLYRRAEKPGLTLPA